MKNLLKNIIPGNNIITTSFILLILPSCKNIFPDKNVRKSSENHVNGSFLIHIVSVRQGDEEKFIDYMKSVYFPVWYNLKDRGRLYETSVFQIKTMDTLQTEIPSKNFLILIHLAPEALSDHLPEAAKNFHFSFTAFETEKIISITDDGASWNQVHISGDYPEYLELDCNSLYTDLFYEEFSIDLDSIWDLLLDIRELPANYSRHIIKELHVH